MKSIDCCPKEKAREERALKEAMLNMNSKEVSEFLVVWTKKNLTCSAQLRLFLKYLVKKVKKVKPGLEI